MEKQEQIQESTLEWWAIQDLREYLNVEGIWKCKVCGRRYKYDEYSENGENGQTLIDKHIKEYHQDAIKELKPELELQAIEEEKRRLEKWAEEDRLEAYRKAHHQCPCEKVIEGVKFTGFLGVLGLGMFITLADEGLKRGFDWIEKQIKEDKK